MIADSSPVDGFKGSLDVVGVKLAPLAGFFRWFTHGLAVECEAVSGVHEAVEDNSRSNYNARHDYGSATLLVWQKARGI